MANFVSGHLWRLVISHMENVEPPEPEESSAPEPELVDADKVKITPKGVLLAIANLFTMGLTGGG